MKGKSKASGSTKTDSKLAVQKGKKGAVKHLKRPPSAFFVFMDDFRQEYKAKNPNNRLVSVVSKAGGVKWKSLSEKDKAPYVEKAAKLKSEYEKLKTAQENEEEVAEAGSEKSKSDVEDESGDGDEDED
ncbi:hypothetical protein LUZ60_014551 [Juncus effusus]|nr:hypothetical protein LUZ60_014551 [Juncus effusus]